jgi:DNA processing protein
VLILRCLLGTTPRMLHELIWREASASAALGAIRAGSAGSKADQAFAQAADPARIRERVADAGARFAVPGDHDYWPALLRLPDPPVGIFVRGHPLDPGRDRVAVVGSRRPTAVGREVARDLGRGLAAAGCDVTSGGAIGIDACAHEGALDAGGRTIAVLGSGIDVVYPATNRALLRRVVEQGTVVSEYPPGVPAEPFRFPARNRLIAGLSIAVVIVEGNARSGTRSTADHATDLGMDLFAVPGPVTSPLSETPLALIRQGATMIRGVGDLLDDLGIDRPRLGARPAPAEGLPPTQAAVLDAVIEPMLPDAVAREVGVSIGDAVTALIHLELRGLIRGSGGRYEPAYEAAPSARASAPAAPPERTGRSGDRSSGSG